MPTLFVAVDGVPEGQQLAVAYDAADDLLLETFSGMASSLSRWVLLTRL